MLFIDIFAVSYSLYFYNFNSIFYCVNYPVIADPDTIGIFFSFEFFYTSWSWILNQLIYCSYNVLNKGFWDRQEFFLCRFLKSDVIHALNFVIFL